MSDNYDISASYLTTSDERRGTTLSRRSYIQGSLGAGVAISMGSVRASAFQPKDATSIRLIRHATTIIRYAGSVLLVDPMLSDRAAMPPISNSPNPRPNPLVPLPIPAGQVLAGVEAVLVTHTHRDHWDADATRLVPKDTTVFIQPPDSSKFGEWGFSRAQKIEDSISWKGIRISRTGGQHGRGEIGQKMAPVSGYVLSSQGRSTVYIAGDTVWCPEVADAIQSHQPDIIIVNAGAAQFLEGGPITMATEDVVRVCQAAPKARVIAVHMEAINHCVLTRSALQNGLENAALKTRILIPQDGQALQFA
jgi:L-ascorbate metabolism protein UlaG (beta-lactamase superfamily)